LKVILKKNKSMHSKAIPILCILIAAPWCLQIIYNIIRQLGNFKRTEIYFFLPSNFFPLPHDSEHIIQLHTYMPGLETTGNFSLHNLKWEGTQSPFVSNAF